MDLIYLVAEETDAVGMFQRIGEDVYHRTAHGELAGGAHEVHFFKAFLDEPSAQVLVVHLFARLYAEKGVGEFLGRWQLLLQCLGVGDDKEPSFRFFVALLLRMTIIIFHPERSEGSF